MNFREFVDKLNESLDEGFVTPVSKTSNHAFGKFKKPETAGNKKFKVHLTADKDGKEVRHETVVHAYNREGAYHHAKVEMRKKHGNALSNISADHIGLHEAYKMPESDAPTEAHKAVFASIHKNFPEHVNHIKHHISGSELSLHFRDDKTEDKVTRHLAYKEYHKGIVSTTDEREGDTPHLRDRMKQFKPIPKPVNESASGKWHWNVHLTAQHADTDEQLQHHTSVVARDANEAHEIARKEMLKKHPKATYIANVHRPDGYKPAK